MDDILVSGMSIGMRLNSIEFPNGGTSAIVTFEMMSQGHKVGDSTRTLAMIKVAAPCSGREAPAYEDVVAHAACKLKANLQSIADFLDKTYCPG